MTTGPKAKRFRIRPEAKPGTTPAEAAPEVSPFEPVEDGFGGAPFPTAAAADTDAPTTPGPNSAEEIAAIRAEGLSGRQLRTARRVAQKHGIEASSDFEAVRLLRRRGIDPFQPTGALAALVGAEVGDRVQLPQPLPSGQTLPATADLNPEDRRAREIIAMQRDIAQRRRQRLALLVARLAVFVLLPTLIAGWYYFRTATPLYATNTEFVIQKAEQQGGGLGGLFAGIQLGSSQDSVTVQSYLQSREALLRLDHDLAYKQHFAQDHIDPLRRLDPDASNEKAYKLYRKNVKIGYDPTEGVVRMEVIAADPQMSVAFSKALIGYAEEQVDHLTQRLREDQMEGARQSYAEAEAKVLEAQQKVLALQEQMGILDPASESGLVMQQVSAFETQMQQKRLELQQLLDNPSPNKARVDGVRGDIARLESLIAGLRATLTQSTGGASSLASVTGQLRIAEADLQTRQLMLSQAAQQLETARIEANKQVRYLSMGVRPVAPDEPTYPRAFENTVLAFLIFSGIYLMLSLTAAILREQVSA
ncbi:capsule biosynthesis protein [Candidatus Falkowbacteria bacterium]|nr:capsule biosynthesis protein [Candidatus Falkowbacteria bacterium]